MKKIFPLLPFTALLVFSSCHFSVGVKKEFATGLTYKYNGLEVKNVLLVGPDKNPMSDNKVQLNTQIGIVAVGVTHFTLKEGKAIPGMTLSVTDKNGLAVLQQDDLLPGMEGYPPEAASQLLGSITVGKPMMSGETYHVKLHIWDKVKPASELNVELDIVVQ